MTAELAEPIVVLGGGPAGALMATLLGRRGHRVTLYESRPDMRRVDIGAGRSINLALATRGIVALEAVEVMHLVDPITIPMRGRMVHVGGTERLQPYGIREHEVIHSVSRRDLNAILLDAAEATGNVRIEFGQRCRSVDLEARQLTLTDTTMGGSARIERFGVLIAADGASSVVRDAVVLANGGVADVDRLDHGYKELEIRAGPNGQHRLDPNALHIWPRGEFMLIALANPEGDFTVTLFAPLESVDHARTDSFDSLVTAEAVSEFFAREFPDFVALVPDLAAQFTDHPVGHMSTIRTTGWSAGADVVLLGDAAHGIVPFHGQGMNAAMESAVLLDRVLGTHDDVEEAFRHFEVVRRPDTDAIADMALENYVEMRAGVVDPTYVLRRELALELERRWPEHLSSRYSMVMFSTMPYAAAKERAERQQQLLARLTRDVTTIGEVDFGEAERLVRSLPVLPPRRTPGDDLSWR